MSANDLDPCEFVVKTHIGKSSVRRLAIPLNAAFAATCTVLTTALGWPVTSFRYQDFDG